MTLRVYSVDGGCFWAGFNLPSVSKGSGKKLNRSEDGITTSYPRGGVVVWKNPDSSAGHGEGRSLCNCNCRPTDGYGYPHNSTIWKKPWKKERLVIDALLIARLRRSSQ